MLFCHSDTTPEHVYRSRTRITTFKLGLGSSRGPRIGSSFSCFTSHVKWIKILGHWNRRRFLQTDDRSQDRQSWWLISDVFITARYWSNCRLGTRQRFLPAGQKWISTDGIVTSVCLICVWLDRFQMSISSSRETPNYTRHVLKVTSVLLTLLFHQSVYKNLNI